MRVPASKAILFVRIGLAVVLAGIAGIVLALNDYTAAIRPVVYAICLLCLFAGPASVRPTLGQSVTMAIILVLYFEIAWMPRLLGMPRPLERPAVSEQHPAIGGQ